MALHSQVKAPQAPDPLDVPFRPLSIRSIPPRFAARAVNIADRVRGEFVEMRGFSPTVQQAARLFDISADACRDVLTTLEREGFLTRTPDGRYRLQA